MAKRSSRSKQRPKIVLFFAIGLLLVGVLSLRHQKSGDRDASEKAAENLANHGPQGQSGSEIAMQGQRETIARVDVNRIEEFFTIHGPKFPIVETVTYTPRVSWNEGKPAWIEAYASHYKTSRHFIARSLHGTADYSDQKVRYGERLNVFKLDYPVSFHIVVDTSEARLWFYYLDELSGERVLVKSYPVGLGRPDSNSPSGMLTPLGVYTLGDKTAIYRQGVVGNYNAERTEMIQVFGTRWIPFDRALGECTHSAKGLGLHGCPWKPNAEGVLAEDRSGLTDRSSDGCIRLATEDIEELYAIVISKPTTVHLVEHCNEVDLPGWESAKTAALQGPEL